MMRPSPIYWLSGSVDNLPAGVEWLAPAEARVYAGLGIEKRRKDWLLGRWTAKQAVSTLRRVHGLHALEDRRIEVLAATDGAPAVRIDGVPVPWTLSISHSSGRSLCALVEARVGLGCDLERIEPRSETFVVDYFTEAERQWMAASPAEDRPWLANLIWSAKESALKVSRTGLRADTRAVEVRLEQDLRPDPGWRPLRVVKMDSEQVLDGWCRVTGGFVETLISGLPCNLPAELLPPTIT